MCNNVSNDGGKSGLYRVTIPPKGQMAEFKDGSGFLGSVLNENGSVVSGQARLNPLTYDTLTLFMAATLIKHRSET